MQAQGYDMNWASVFIIRRVDDQLIIRTYGEMFRYMPGIISFNDLLSAIVEFTITNQKSKKHGFKNTDAAGQVPHAIKEQARLIVAKLLD